MANKRVVLLNNDNLTIVLESGEIIYFSPATVELYTAVKDATEQGVRDILIQAAEAEKHNALKQAMENAANEQVSKESMEKLIDIGGFIMNNSSLFLEGTPFPLPDSMIMQFSKCIISDKEIDNERIEALKNFWYLACLNPNEAAREGMHEFLERTDYKIMGNGMCLAYRKVVSNGADKELVAFISNQYMKIKTIRKQDPEDYFIYSFTETISQPVELEEGYYDDDEGEYVEPVMGEEPVEKTSYALIKAGESIPAHWVLTGNLTQLYLDLPDMEYSEFTDQRTKTFKIKIGQEVTMPREQCDSNGKNDCSAGLHLCTNLQDYASFGDVSLVCAFSPRNVVSIPESTTTKMRVCAYMPLAILEPGEERFLDDAYTLHMADEYAVEDLAKVREELMGKDLATMSYKQMDDLLSKLDIAKDVISNRIKQYQE